MRTYSHSPHRTEQAVNERLTFLDGQGAAIPWVNERTTLLLARLGEYEMTLPEDVARQLISDHLDTTAELMRIGREAAKTYVTDNFIVKIADHLLGIDQAKTHDGVLSLTAARRRRHQIQKP